MIILHIVGPSFAGKTSYIEKNLPNEIVFDVRKYYEENDDALAEAQRDYKSYKRNIQGTIKEYISGVLKTYAKTKTKKFLVIESSGHNKAINDYIAQFNSFTILIETPQYVILELINQYIKDVGTGKQKRLAFDPRKQIETYYKAFSFGNITYDVKYFTRLDQYFPAFSIEKARQLLSDKEFTIMAKLFQ
ncbi:MAG: hypothetical protein ACFFG0_10645 [Candidatus Thorarchaeota archaeon]